ncbi:MAG: GTPase HflX [Pseudomonadales bacterium]|nr:GTPase HflX [Pseudomonadales bacterium]
MFFERPETGTRALLVHVQDDACPGTASELEELARSAGLEPVGCVTARRHRPDPRTWIGSGKMEEVAAAANGENAELVVFDQDLSPTQERNLEKGLARRVLGRTGLILHIFAQRARTHEGKLQVELAQLEHASTRLVRGWTHLDRQRGGSGRGQGSAAGLGGAGETQLEADQRMLRTRIKQINQRLLKVRKQRNQNRRARVRAEVKTVSLAGYTNAGKSTLFNRVCHADVHQADQLFATLDPTLRKLEIPVMGRVVLTDTVGFIRDLPHTLIDAFRATLEEVRQADLLLHVVDASSPDRTEHIAEVNRVLKEIDGQDIPQLLVYNKTDLIDEPPRVDRDGAGKPVRVWVSSLTGDGMEMLLDAIGDCLSDQVVETTLNLEPHEGRLRARLFELGAVLDEEVLGDGRIALHVRLEEHELERLTRRAGLSL